MVSSKGSTWNKWDLHVHSPASFHENFGLNREIEPGEDHEEAIWDRYLDRLEEIEDIPCIGITDYFSIEGYKRVRREIDENDRLENLDLVIPNVELRINNFITSRHGDSADAIEMHVLFSDELSPELIQDEFLSQIAATDPDGDEIAVTRDSLEELGRDPRFQQSTDATDPYVAGCNLISVKWDTVQKALQRKRLQGKTLSVVVEAEWQKLDWGSRAGAERSALLTKTDAMFVQKDKDRKWFLGLEGGYTPERFAERFGATIPGIRGSDTHSFENFCRPAKDRYCWIKADTTFEGLKQIKYEPTDRVGIGSESPQRRVSIHTPSRLSIRQGNVADTLEIQDTDLPLNPNLVTVIGGKGAGKTALLDLLANCYENQYLADEDASIDTNSFIQRIQEHDPSVKTKLVFDGDDIEPFEKYVLDEDTITHSRIEYLPQGKISEFCRNDEHMHQKVLDLVQISTKRNHPEILSRFEDTKEQIEEITDELQELTHEIHQLDPETIDERIDKVYEDLDVIDGRIADKREEIQEFRANHEGDIDEDTISRMEERLEDIEDSLSVANEIKEKIREKQAQLDHISQFNKLASGIQTLSKSIGLDIQTSQIDTTEFSAQIESNLEATDARIEKLNEDRDKLEEELNELQDVSGELSALKRELRELESEQDEIRGKKDALEQTRSQINQLQESRVEKFVDYLKRYHRLRDIYSEMISLYLEGKSEILDEVRFTARLQLQDGLQSELYELLDGRSVNVGSLNPIVDSASDAIDNFERVETHINSYLDGALEFKNNLKSGASIVDYEQRIFGDHIKLGERILLDETPLSDLSLGQKGTVLLKILLAQGDKALIIDQPEENLDNRFIYRTLKDAFRKAKTDRQVIIATHNANLVVNTDAEQVIVANYEKNNISFRSGALENPDIRNEVADVLEGGEDAFLRREQKYGFTE